MTYRELAQYILEMDEQQLNSDLTILESNNEFYPAKLCFAKKETNDTLDNNHPFISQI